MPKKLVFDGAFKYLIPQYIEYKKALGYAYDYDYSKRLRQMSNFFEQNYPNSKIILSKEMVLDFIKKRDNEASSTISSRCAVIRGFATFLVQQGYNDIYILPNQYIPKKSTNFIPYIFSKEQITLLYNIIDNYKFGSDYLNEHKIYSTLIRLLYGCGLRLNVTDLLFPNPEGHIYSQSSVYKKFKNFFEIANIYNTNNNSPRVHDLRHTYAVHALQKMIENGMDIYCTLPFLSSFLGHANIQTTEHYLRLVENNFKDILYNDSNNIFPEVKDYE